MKENTPEKRKKQIDFAVGMAGIDGGKPSAFTKELLKQYETGQLSAAQLKQAIVDEYTRTI